MFVEQKTPICCLTVNWQNVVVWNYNLWMHLRKLLGKVFVTLLQLHLSISALFPFNLNKTTNHSRC